MLFLDVGRFYKRIVLNSATLGRNEKVLGLHQHMTQNADSGNNVMQAICMAYDICASLGNFGLLHSFS